MSTHPYLASQLAREHHRQMLAAASQRQPPPQQGHQASRTANGAAKIIRRLATLIAKSDDIRPSQVTITDRHLNSQSRAPWGASPNGHSRSAPGFVAPSPSRHLARARNSGYGGSPAPRQPA